MNDQLWAKLSMYMDSMQWHEMAKVVVKYKVSKEEIKDNFGIIVFCNLLTYHKLLAKNPNW